MFQLSCHWASPLIMLWQLVSVRADNTDKAGAWKASSSIKFYSKAVSSPRQQTSFLSANTQYRMSCSCQHTRTHISIWTPERYNHMESLSKQKKERKKQTNKQTHKVYRRRKEKEEKHFHMKWKERKRANVVSRGGELCMCVSINTSLCGGVTLTLQ